MYEILKDLNPDLKLAMKDEKIWILKRIFPDDADVYRKLIGIRNENIASVSEIITLDGMTFAVREYVQGISLDEYIEKNKPVSEEETKRIILGICSGLSSIHKLGIVHRDITPSNIIISDDSIVKIIDFGISRTIKENKGRDTMILGTAGYAAPEQFGFSQTGIRADIFAVGALMNYMLTGCMPNEKYADGFLGDIVRKSTQIDENNRYESAEELADAIRAINPFSQKFRTIVPGFRKGIKSHKIGASVFYILYISAVLLEFKINSSAIDIFLNILVWTFFFMIPFLIFTDFLCWTEKIRWISQLTEGRKKVLKTVLTVASVFIGSMFII
ncbi:MAG: serine/threonine protein kinase [Clostridia bacterium]|nr:serine/threonine protein kinase [Clostridia bacterium]